MVKVIKERSDTYAQDWGMYVKKPCIVNATQMGEDFEVHTVEGVIRGRVGDFLIQGTHGELYPCKLEVFIDTYEAARRCDPPPYLHTGEK